MQRWFGRALAVALQRFRLVFQRFDAKGTDTTMVGRSYTVLDSGGLGKGPIPLWWPARTRLSAPVSAPLAPVSTPAPRPRSLPRAVAPVRQRRRRLVVHLE